MEWTYREAVKDVEEDDEEYGAAVDEVAEAAQVERSHGHVFPLCNHVRENGDGVRNTAQHDE